MNNQHSYPVCHFNEMNITLTKDWNPF